MSTTITNTGINWTSLRSLLTDYGPVIESFEGGMPFQGRITTNDYSEDISGRVEILYDTNLRMYELRASIGEGLESSESILSPFNDSGHMTIHGTNEIQLIERDAVFEEILLEDLVLRQIENLKALISGVTGEKTIKLLQAIKRIKHLVF